MADSESINTPVEVAEKPIWAVVAEMHAICEMVTSSDDYSPLLVVSHGAMQRFCDAWDVFHHQILKHGYPGRGDTVQARGLLGGESGMGEAHVNL